MTEKRIGIASPHKLTTKIRALLAASLLFTGLVAIGAGLHYWKGELFWGGYLSMAFFYTVMFYLGLAVVRKEDNQIRELLLAGRSLPLGMALLTMTAINFPFRTTSMIAGLLTIIVVSRLTTKISPVRPLRSRSI